MPSILIQTISYPSDATPTSMFYQTWDLTLKPLFLLSRINLHTTLPYHAHTFTLIPIYIILYYILCCPLQSLSIIV